MIISTCINISLPILQRGTDNIQRSHKMPYRDAEADPIPEETASNPLFTIASRCCFCFPCISSSRRSSSSCAVGLTWWSRSVTAFKKVREWSELVAGPKWKTFIRRFNRHKGSGGYRQGGKFQYDPLSYALNFDEGSRGQNGNLDDEEIDDYGGFRDFSSRYASVSASGRPLAMNAERSNMNLNDSNKDVAVFA